MALHDTTFIHSSTHPLTLSLSHSLQSKSYGLKKSIEGAYTPNETCLVIEDLITSGISIFETIEPLESVGLIVKDIVVLIDREQGGRSNIEARGYQVHALMTMSQILKTLRKYDKLTQEQVDQVHTFLSTHQVLLSIPEQKAPVKEYTYGERVEIAKNEVTKMLLKVMEVRTWQN